MFFYAGAYTALKVGKEGPRAGFHVISNVNAARETSI